MITPLRGLAFLRPFFRDAYSRLFQTFDSFNWVGGLLLYWISWVCSTFFMQKNGIEAFRGMVNTPDLWYNMSI